ncbi:hypothetical protein EON83_18630 [bacterium]|nr:MAG: hypothetical protein EON83_18630 [bacterium]
MKNICTTVALGLVAGALALSTGATSAQAQTSTTMTATATPMPVSGTVLRYYVDRAGFVSAMDVQATDGVKMVRFSPSMAQRLTGTYPVGSQIAAYVTSSGMGTMTSYDLAGMGTDMPAPGMMMSPMSVTDLDVLRSWPYIMIGSKSMRTLGKLTGYVPDPTTGEVLAIILDNTTLVRVPVNNRLPQTSPAPEGVIPMFKNSDVVAYGYEEAPRYGAVSPYSKRIVATGISVAGRTLGPFGFGKVMPTNKGTLLGFNLNFFGGAAPREVQAADSGYSTYMAPGTTPSM